MNNARGYLAEFIVARALGIEDIRRVEWDAYDLMWGDITIEVKSSAYLQSWDQRKLSNIVFTGLRATRWHPRHNLDPLGPRLNAMVYVFCVQTADRHEQYDPLNADQWEFYILGRSALQNLGYKSIGLSTLRKVAGEPLHFAQLPDAVATAARGQRRGDDRANWWDQSK